MPGGIARTMALDPVAVWYRVSAMTHLVERTKGSSTAVYLRRKYSAYAVSCQRCTQKEV